MIERQRPEEYRITFDSQVPGENWHVPERTANDSYFCWTGPGTHSSLDLRLETDSDLVVECCLQGAVNAEVLASMILTVNEQPIALDSRLEDGKHVYQGIVSKAVLNKNGVPICLAFDVSRTFAPAELDPSSSDWRRIGLAVAWIRLLPVDNSANQTADYWSDKLTSTASSFSAQRYWLAIPEVQKHFNHRATAGSGMEWYGYVVRRFFADRMPVDRVLSMGCGVGALERVLAQMGFFKHCDAVDIAPAAIEVAKRSAESEGITSVDFRVSNVEAPQLLPEHYDSVWFSSSLHHLRNLESVCDQVRCSLKPDGYLVVNEYVGANYFGFGERQQQVIRSAFDLIPARFRRSFGAHDFGNIRSSVALPIPEDVQAADVTEAVRASEIMEILPRYFDIVFQSPCGGSILQYLLHEIAGNFCSEDSEAIRVLDMLFTIEDTLIEVGDLASDFVLIVASPKP